MWPFLAWSRNKVQAHQTNSTVCCSLRIATFIAVVVSAEMTSCSEAVRGGL